MKYNAENIKTRFKEFPKYRFGWEHTLDTNIYEDICYGIGWNTPVLYMIIVEPKKIIYEISYAFLRNSDMRLEVDYSSEFIIPTEANFKDFIVNFKVDGGERGMGTYSFNW